METLFFWIKRWSLGILKFRYGWKTFKELLYIVKSSIIFCKAKRILQCAFWSIYSVFQLLKKVTYFFSYLNNIYIEIGKKTKRLYSHPYKPVSWLLTHLGILLSRIFIYNRALLLRIELWRKNQNTDPVLYIYIHIFIYILFFFFYSVTQAFSRISTAFAWQTFLQR